MSIDLNNRIFKPVRVDGSGDVTSETRFVYHQRGALVWASYRGGAIAHGTLIGTIDSASLSFSYVHVNAEMSTRSGSCTSTVETSSSGILRLVESWEWSEGGTGESVLEEVASPEIAPAPVKQSVGIEALQALDIRLGTIREVRDVPGSKKLVQLIVALGDHERSILAGLKGEREDPTEIVGRQTLFVVNLEPRKMAGVLSEGMLLDIGYEDGQLPALTLVERPLPDGSRAG